MPFILSCSCWISRCCSTVCLFRHSRVFGFPLRDRDSNYIAEFSSVRPRECEHSVWVLFVFVGIVVVSFVGLQTFVIQVLHAALRLRVLWGLRSANQGKEHQRERKREGETAYLLSHPGQSALASGSQAASRGGRSHSSWPRPGGRRHRTRPGSALRLYRSLTAPFKQTADISESAVLTKHRALKWISCLSVWL